MQTRKVTFMQYPPDRYPHLAESLTEESLVHAPLGHVGLSELEHIGSAADFQRVGSRDKAAVDLLEVIEIYLQLVPQQDCCGFAVHGRLDRLYHGFFV